MVHHNTLTSKPPVVKKTAYSTRDSTQGKKTWKKDERNQQEVTLKTMCLKI